MRIGTLGAGQIATAVARHALRHGHDVVLSNSRGPRALAELALELGAKAGTREEAAAGDLVLLAVPWPEIPTPSGAWDRSTAASSWTPQTSSRRPDRNRASRTSAT
ncbi:hypothetical protein SVIO_005620 [Streptomyces violaceusniger]|uniref:Pyrroline-5-carboxylate reductase catalytic N-terminal domain-containing protein n=1 Tax=Streptomyces violaceusniger TaxID=68280 RepID=A0A4D4KVR8_STRVO|nr:hypothetical protein SVIO_005620 [Streptomyces violaceusniger]